MSLHDRPGKSDEWYTPPHIFEAMAVHFDLDVAHPGLDRVSWVPAETVYCRESLERAWSGFVWMNPPFGGRNGIVPWLDKFFAHGDGVALTPDRVSAPWWHDAAAKADLVLIVRSKPKFLDADLVPQASPPMGVTLMASGPRGVMALLHAQQAGLGLLWRQACAA